MGILALEESRGDRPLVVRHEGAVLTLPDPRNLHHGAIMQIIAAGGVGLVSVPMSLNKLEILLDRWLAHHGLGTRADVGRLSFLVEKYEPHLTYDLQAHLGASLRDYWVSRRWRELLMLIDRLPRWSYYSEAVSNDPEHAKRIAEAQARLNAASGEKEDYHPPLTTWTPEVAVLADLIDAVRSMQHTIVLANTDSKGAKPKPPKAYPRPITALQRQMKLAAYEDRKARHEALARRLLPHKAR